MLTALTGFTEFTGGVLQRLRMGFPRGFILALHEIDPGRLAQLVGSIQPAQPVPLSELVERSKQGRPTSGLFALTVDDGVGDNVRALARLFRAQAWPATFYLPTRYLDSGEGMAFQWWQRLKPFLPRKRLALKSGVIDLSPPDAVDGLFKNMERLWHSRRLESYVPMTMELVEVVVRESGVTRETMLPPAPITWREVAELSKNDSIRFESHGVSHAAMSSLNDQELAFELKHSRDLITEHTGRPCRHLAYPFGSRQSIGRRAAAMSRQFYDSAVTMDLGHVDSANPWLLPRIPLYPENSGGLARLKILLKCNPMNRSRSEWAAI